MYRRASDPSATNSIHLVVVVVVVLEIASASTARPDDKLRVYRFTLCEM